MDRVILHIDFDSFFASVAQEYNPSLRDKPIGITATNGRTAIIAASREAKRYGIHSPSRTYDAKRLCPQIQFVPADFVLYYEVSKKFIKIAKDYSPIVEFFSIDEVFIDVTKTAHLFGGVDTLIAKIRERIKKEIGEYITASIGISYNKLLAKLASGLDKPNGITFITKENLDDIYKRAKLTDICGIGRQIEFRLHILGIYTLMQLRKTPVGLLIKEFGNVEAQFLHNVGLGQDNSEVIPYTQAPTVKSVGRNYCLPHNEYNERVILQHVYELCEEVGIKLRRLGKKAQAVGLFLRGSFNLHEVRTHQQYFDRGDEMFVFCKAIFKKVSPSIRRDLKQLYIRQISVWAGNLTDARYVPQSLFSEERRKEKLIAAIDAINEKFGDHTIRNGFLLYGAKLTTVPNGFGADRYDRTNLTKI